MAARPVLQHLHLPALTPYATVTALQDAMARLFLTHKASPNTAPLPPPTIFTFTPPPVYTTGRREGPNSYSPELIKTLKEPLKHTEMPAEFIPASRGGLITFHGPGQLVIYPTLSLSKPSSFPAYSEKKPLTPKCYVNLLEDTTIRLLERFGLTGYRTADPGVWVKSRIPAFNFKNPTEEMKIAAHGVHLRRNVTSHGVGLNVSTDLRWFERITACGIEDKGVTSLAREVGIGFNTVEEERKGLEAVAKAWVGEFAKEVGANVQEVQEGQVLEQLGFAKWVPSEK